eukprot:SAG31_NODE_11821_length_995_cov_1.148438_1_plen_117_part_00
MHVANLLSDVVAEANTDGGLSNKNQMTKSTTNSQSRSALIEVFLKRSITKGDARPSPYSSHLCAKALLEASTQRVLTAAEIQRLLLDDDLPLTERPSEGTPGALYSSVSAYFSCTG